PILRNITLPMIVRPYRASACGRFAKVMDRISGLEQRMPDFFVLIHRLKNSNILMRVLVFLTYMGCAWMVMNCGLEHFQKVCVLSIQATGKENRLPLRTTLVRSRTIMCSLYVKFLMEIFISGRLLT